MPTFEVTDDELTGLPRVHRMGCDAALLLKDINSLGQLKANEDGRELAIAIAFLEGWIERFGEGLDRMKNLRRGCNA